MKNQTKKIQDLIKTYNHNLKHIPLLAKQSILLKITKELDEEGQYLRAFLKQRGGKLAYLNSFLIKEDISPVTRLKSHIPFFKLALIIIAAGFLILSFTLFWLVDGFLPLYQYNQIDNTASLLGGKILMESDSSTYFSKRDYAYDYLGIEERELPNNFTAKISINEFERISMSAQSIDLLVKSSIDDNIQLNCNSSVDESQNDIKVDNQKVLLINLRGLHQCLLELPRQQFFSLQANKAAVFFQRIAGDFEMNTKKSLITIKKENLDFFKRFSYENLSKTELNVIKKKGEGLYSGNIQTKSGNLFIR